MSYLDNTVESTHQKKKFYIISSYALEKKPRFVSKSHEVKKRSCGIFMKANEYREQRFGDLTLNRYTAPLLKH